MTAKVRLYLAGSGIMTSVGETSEQSLAAIKAGISTYAESSVLGKNHVYLTMALIPQGALPPLEAPLASLALSPLQQRLLRLAAKPLLECLNAVPDGQTVPLFLALPENLPGLRPFPATNFIKYLIAQSGAKNVNAAASRTVSTGRAGGLQALDLAFRYLEATGEQHVIVGGVDSFLDLYNLAVLDQQNRIKSESSMEGFVPGEAGAFILLSSARSGQGKTTAVYYPGLADEPGHRFSDKPYTGDGLAQAMRMAIHNGPGGPIQKIYSSLNGEHFGAKEYGVALIRNSASFTENMLLEHPADCIGDVGAASAPLLIAVGAAGNAGNGLVYCSSDGAYRGAVCIESEVRK